MKEVMLTHMVSTYLSFGIITPISIFCDNQGAIFLANNYEGKHTKYLDIRYHFIREQVRNGFLRILFVPTMENHSDPFTKNVSKILFEKFTNSLQ